MTSTRPNAVRVALWSVGDDGAALLSNGWACDGGDGRIVFCADSSQPASSGYYLVGLVLPVEPMWSSSGIAATGGEYA